MCLPRLALAALVAGCGAAPGGEADDAAKKASTPAATAAAKPDISKAGDVTLTVWDQKVRGGQNARDRGAQQAVRGEVPERHDQAHREVLRGPAARRSSSRSRAPNAPDVVQANQGRADRWARSSRPGCCARSPTTPKVYGWDDRYSPTLLRPQQVLAPTATSSAPATCTGSRRWARSSASTTTRTRSPTPPTTLDEFEASLQEAKAAGETPIMFGNLEKWPGIHNFETVLGQTADKQAVRDFVFAKRRRLLRHPGVPGRRDEAQGVGRQGLLQQGLQRHRTTTRRGRSSPRASAVT